MGRRTEPGQFELYTALRRNGYSKATAAKESGVSRTTADKWDAGLGASVASVKKGLEHRIQPKPIPIPDLCPEAKRALVDFRYFRRRYFGRISTPWQEEAAYRVLAFVESPRKEFVVVNCPPGSGKSTLFTHDIPAWLTARRRHIRGLIISATQTLADSYTLRLRETFETDMPIQAYTDEAEAGLAVDAEATLRGDFGAFRPSHGVWAVGRFTVSQYDGMRMSEKEATWQSYGLDSEFIGSRINFAVADDSVSDKSLLSVDQIDKDRRRWDRVVQRRIEPRGTLVLQGQRLGPEDLYRYALDKKAGASQDIDHETGGDCWWPILGLWGHTPAKCCDAGPGRMYHHVIYRAHDDARCVGLHDEDAPYQGQGGCLLDPRRLGWHELENEMENDLSSYLTVMQQEDADPQKLLIQQLWIDGGTDPATRIEYMGCKDKDRSAYEMPGGLVKPWFSIVTADPSPANFWGIQWWVYVPASEERFLVACLRKVMGANDFLERVWPSGDYIGLLEEWRVMSHRIGYPISHLIFEKNAAQRWAYRYEFFKDWLRKYGVTLLPHDTQRNKSDEKMGVTSLRHVYRHGRARLPYKGDGMLHTLRLTEELTKYPMGRYDDEVMANWFLEFNLPGITIVEETELEQERPTWMLQEARA